ncbi:amino acid-binding protein [Megasphaera sp. ASD88]|uniref:ACT domain-containing protein n=1 Tax=unclassified Megasphaera TaxID=2626256 RepID=UPI000BABFB55|nr:MULTISPECIES: ACT domain-containing protein [unclassified Megasphaera]NJE33869.1 ACT domain-containing protein [Megasphaera sp. SW808]PAV38466.1 amino acid-binding protein [Megasphaera sp. ASD88]
MLNQISLFAENKKGALRRITSVLAQAHINIYTMLANDSAEFGIIRLIVTDPDNALKALQDAGYQCRLDKVLAIDMSDAPGTLDGILSNLQEANVSIDYLYISYNRQTSTPVAVFKTSEPETETFLRGKGYILLNSI